MAKERFEIPDWWDCTWRRITCSQDSCPICGRIKRDRERHIARGEDPDSIEAVMEDVGRNLRETLEMVKKDAEEMGVDLESLDDSNLQEPPEPEEFPLWKKFRGWQEWVSKVLESSYEFEEFHKPKYEEALQDLSWYPNTLLAKAYRQLCNRWEAEHGIYTDETDFEYTRYAIRECGRLIREALLTLDSAQINPQPAFLPLLTRLIELQKQMPRAIGRSPIRANRR